MKKTISFLNIFTFTFFCMGKPHAQHHMMSDIWAGRTSVVTVVKSRRKLDSLAAQGVRFTQFYNTGRCCPTRATLY